MLDNAMYYTVRVFRSNHFLKPFYCDMYDIEQSCIIYCAIISFHIMLNFLRMIHMTYTMLSMIYYKIILTPFC